MKRKANDFTDVSFSSPSPKLRKLDGDVYMPMEVEQKSRAMFSMEEYFSSISTGVEQNEAHLDPLTLASHPDDRAIVLYSPNSTPFFKSPASPDFSIVLNSGLIPGLKDLVFCLGNMDPVAETNMAGNDCLAIVPWNASQLSQTSSVDAFVIGQSEKVEDEGEELDMMDT